MSEHHHHHNHSAHHASAPSPWRAFHRHWLFVVAAILMLIAMIVYVLTMDDSTVVVPGQPAVQQAADI